MIILWLQTRVLLMLSLHGKKDNIFDEFTILAHGNKKYLLEIKESLLIKHNQPVLNKSMDLSKNLLLIRHLR